MSDPVRCVTRLVGVYDADGSVRGELAYVVGHLVGNAHCSLCEVTHGRLRERASWRACRARLPVPFVTYHRDDQPDAVRAAAGTTPVVLAELDDGSHVALLDGAALDRCGGDPEALARAIEDEVPARGLRWSSSA
jgi:hypothetical protein